MTWHLHSMYLVTEGTWSPRPATWLYDTLIVIRPPEGGPKNTVRTSHRAGSNLRSGADHG